MLVRTIAAPNCCSAFQQFHKHTDRDAHAGRWRPASLCDARYNRSHSTSCDGKYDKGNDCPATTAPSVLTPDSTGFVRAAFHLGTTSAATWSNACNFPRKMSPYFPSLQCPYIPLTRTISARHEPVLNVAARTAPMCSINNALSATIAGAHACVR